MALSTDQSEGIAGQWGPESKPSPKSEAGYQFDPPLHHLMPPMVGVYGHIGGDGAREGGGDGFSDGGGDGFSDGGGDGFSDGGGGEGGGGGGGGEGGGDGEGHAGTLHSW